MAEPRQFSWRVATLFALRFAAAAGISFTLMILIMVASRTYRDASFGTPLRESLIYSLTSGLFATLWTWIVTVLTSFFARRSRPGRVQSIVVLGIVFSLLTHGVITAVVKLGLKAPGAVSILAAWALLFPIVVTLILMRPKSD